MRLRFPGITGVVIAGLGSMAFFAQAESYHALDLPRTSNYGEQQTTSESDRHEYVSRGQDYLRQYFRENRR